MGDYTKIHKSDIKIAKIVGENEDGLTLFVPKDMEGTFHLTDGDKFLSLMFVKQDGHGGVMIWTPWEATGD